MIALAMMAATTVASAQEPLPEFGFPVANPKQEKAVEVRRIRGIVVDENGAVIPKAKVVLRKGKPERIVAMAHHQTDSVGRFQFNAPKGRYEAVVDKMGLKQQFVPVAISSKGAPGFKVVMTVQGMVDYIRTPESSP
ncbi:MAG TPA: carboxypeptidase-like regulatory domain-containing protein [Terriglobales bacterium]|nr:carboxypeptidase-like regulatory domain-containing protein [Terriglobales bacterium]